MKPSSLPPTPIYIPPPTVTPDLTSTAQSLTETVIAGTWYAELTAEATAATRTPLQPMPTLPPPQPISVLIRWSPDGVFIADLREGQLRIIDAQTGEVLRFSSPMPLDIAAFDWHPTQPLFAVGTDTGKVMIWTIASRSGDLLLLSHVTILEFGSYMDYDMTQQLLGVGDLKWSRYGDYLAAGGLMGVQSNLQIWRTSDYTLVLRGNIGVGVEVIWSPLDDTLAVMATGNLYLLNTQYLRDGETLEVTLDEWQRLTRHLMVATPEPHQYSRSHNIYAAAWNNTGDQLALVDNFSKVWLIDQSTGLTHLLANLQPHGVGMSHDVTSLIWDSDGRILWGVVMVREVVMTHNPYDRYFQTNYVNILAWDTTNAAVIERFRSNVYNTTLDGNPLDGRLVFGDVPTDPYATNLITSGAVRIVDGVGSN